MPESKSNLNPQGRCLAVFGTGSDVGKSVIATALCRCLVHRGIRVAPYKAQNMSNNSGVTPEGLEMGRAQIVQAEACGLPPHVDMNPVLLKPTSDIGAQVVLMGRVLANASAVEYHQRKKTLFRNACTALDRLRNRYGAVVLEGAGSCAEVNLMDGDIVNLPMAEYAQAPVVLVADIHRGGVFAQLVGTLECLPQQQRDRIAGFIINRFHGDIQLFKNGVDWIEKKTGKPVFGVVPWYEDIQIEQEDSVVIESPRRVFPTPDSQPAVAVLRLPHIANFNDIDPLRSVQGLDLFFIEKHQPLSSFAAVIIPGSKNTRKDLVWLYETGWSETIRKFHASGGHVLGICGGYQMMGAVVADPDGTEGSPGETKGLDLLPVSTVLVSPKTTTVTRFSWMNKHGEGYEIHMGKTIRSGGNPLFSVSARNGMEVEDEDGTVSADGLAMGTYVHGLFDTPAILSLWMNHIGLPESCRASEEGGLAGRNRQYDRLADHFERHVDLEQILGLLHLQEGDTAELS